MEEIRNKQGEKLDYSLHTPTEKSSEAIAVIGHGVTANKDREFLVTLGNALAESGIEAVRFSFSGNGKSEGDFRSSCPTKEVEDLKAIIDVFSGREIIYVGHSMGGAVGVLAIYNGLPISRFISLAGMVHTALFASVEFGDVEPDSKNGFMWEKPDCPLSKSFIDDMNAIDSVLPLAPSITIPWLIIHGAEDDVVPLEHSKEIADANRGVSLFEIPKADHVFSEESWSSEMSGQVVKWLKGG